MVAVGIDNALRLFEQILVNLLSLAKLHTVVGPRRTLGLQIQAHLISSRESCLGRTVAMKADVVESVVLTLAEYAQPLSLAGGRIARFGETAVFHGAAQVEFAAVDIHLRTFNLQLAESEGNRNVRALILHRTGIEAGMELVPQLSIAA